MGVPELSTRRPPPPFRRPAAESVGAAVSVGWVTDERVRADGVRVLITGGTSGLGRAMAAALLDAGASLVLTSREDGRAAAAARELDDGSGRAVGVGMDVRDEH